MIPNKIAFGKKSYKYVIRYKDNRRISHLCIMALETNGYVKMFDETKYMSLLKKYNDVWDKVSNIIKKRFDNESVYKEKYLKTKIKCYEGKINTDFMVIEC